MREKSRVLIIPFFLMGFLFFLTSSCNNLKVGDDYGGGKIAYIFEEGDTGYIEGETHGIIAAPLDQSTGGFPWGIRKHDFGWLESAIGSGKENTHKIVSVYGNGNYAAKLCYDLVLAGYDDWYLPSSFELRELFENRKKIGGFSPRVYWSSSQADNADGGAYGSDFVGYYSSNYGMMQKTIYIRAIRYF